MWMVVGWKSHEMWRAATLKLDEAEGQQQEPCQNEHIYTI